MRAVAILAAAGRGERLGGDAPKAFLEIAGRSLLTRAAETLSGTPQVERFLVAAPPGLEAHAERLAASPKLLHVVTGGASRVVSVRAALAAVPAGVDAIVVHDVARPFASAGLFASVIEALGAADAAVPALRVADTLKRVEGGWVRETLDREGLAAIQTPQAFRRHVLEEAHRRAEAEGMEATDDAALVERAGYKVAVVPGDPGNLKVTTPADLALAERLARSDG